MNREQMTTRQAREHAIAEMLQTFDTDLLSAIARGEIDVGPLARAELANRGLNGAGRWVGFDKAMQLAERVRA